MNFDLIKIIRDNELSCMTIRQLGVLLSLFNSPKNSASIARELNVDKSVLTRTIKKLFKLKLVEFSKTDAFEYSDQRKRYIYLSEKARMLLSNENV